jgi:signal transduction histidine kinase
LGLTLSIWLLTGYQFAQRMTEIETEATAVNARYTRAQARLSQLRSQVLLGSVYVRDALLDPDPASIETYRRQLEGTYRAAERALTSYEPIWNSKQERERLAGLHHELDDFRTTVQDVLGTDNTRWATDARLLLNGRIMPKRESVIQVSEQVQAMNRTALMQQRNDMSDVYRTIQRVMWERLGLGLAGSLAIAVLAAVYAGRLEDRIRRQRARDIQNTRDVERLSAKLICAQEDERRSIARDLHDEVGQVLTAIKVELGFAQRAIEASGGSPQLLNDARAVTDGALQTVRDLSRLLHPVILEDLGLPAATRDFVKGFAKRHDIRVELALDQMERRLSPEVETAAYRTIQEALTNVARHARATVSRVTLRRSDQMLRVTIEDNGVGFDAAAADAPGHRRGLGLIGIRERVAQLDGVVRLQSQVGKGTTLSVELPAHLRATADDGDDPISSEDPRAILRQAL